MATEVRTNGTAPTTVERAAIDRTSTRMRARLVSLYRTSRGLQALVIDAAGAEHLGVTLARAR